jgi:hypothetical protein
VSIPRAYPTVGHGAGGDPLHRDLEQGQGCGDLVRDHGNHAGRHPLWTQKRSISPTARAGSAASGALDVDRAAGPRAGSRVVAAHAATAGTVVPAVRRPQHTPLGSCTACAPTASAARRWWTRCSTATASRPSFTAPERDDAVALCRCGVDARLACTAVPPDLLLSSKVPPSAALSRTNVYVDDSGPPGRSSFRNRALPVRLSAVRPVCKILRGSPEEELKPFPHLS